MGKSNRYIRIVGPFLSRVRLIGGLFLGLWIAPVSAQMSLQQRQANLASFDQAWTTIRDQHWDPKPGGLDWDAVGAEFRPKMERAATTEDARAVLRFDAATPDDAPDAALLAVIGFPAFAVEDASVVARTRTDIVAKLRAEATKREEEIQTHKRPAGEHKETK